MAQFDSKHLKKIAVLTSGGDAPGMNAAIRSVVRTAISQNLDVFGVTQGFTGLIDQPFVPLNLRSVANIIQKGGTVLKSGRCSEFHQEKQRIKSIDNLNKHGINALICIGGNGTFQGAHLLWQEHQYPVIGVPGTIDNDIEGTDTSIGFDTAVNTALDAIDRIRDTAASHDRLFIVEVMGRNSGFIASYVGLAGGAEEIFIPEVPFNINDAVNVIKRGISRGKTSSILVTAEGQKAGRAYDLAEALRKKVGYEARVCILGHIQRGGSPTAADRILASRLGANAISLLLKGHCDIMVGVKNNAVTPNDLSLSLNNKTFNEHDLTELAKILSN